MPVTLSRPDPIGTIQPVEFLEGERPERKPKPGMALCLSGGGYRAMLFHLGALWRLNEAGYLGKLKRISSVSGGSITAGVLGLRWRNLNFVNGVAGSLVDQVVAPVRNLAGHSIDAASVVEGILLPRKSIAAEIADAYRRHLGLAEATLQDLPTDEEGPRFVINATNVQTKVLWRFSRPYMGDYRVGLIKNPSTELAVAIGASSAFPPFLSPVVLENPGTFDPQTAGDLQKSPFTTKIVLTDGGVYDNLGLETAWKEYDTILVSDGGAATADDPEPHGDWARHVYRVLNLIDNQVGALRKRMTIYSYKKTLRKGAYWGIRTDIRNYKLSSAMDAPRDKTLALAATPTRLKALDPTLQERLINWGYAVCDAALRKHVDGKLGKPKDFPYPDAWVGEKS